VDIQFASDKLESLCTNFNSLMKKHGKVRAKRIMRRLDDLHAAETLADMQNLPGRCHELKGDRAGQLSLDLDHPYRLIFTPSVTPLPPRKPDGGIDWSQVTAVTILDVEDTHR